MGRFLVVFFASGLAGCAATGATPRPFPVPGPTPAEPSVERPGAPPAASTGGGGYAISGTALSLRGTPYRNGGSDPAGFDCSGFVWYVFDRHGVHVPRTVGEQSQAGSHVDQSDLRPGDLLFFDTGGATFQGSRATHVGISVGGDQFVHAPSTTGQVRVERLGSSYWAPRFLEARRVQ
jgi:peptidoglycan endopeptidase LytE